jgi:SWI/SNF-related matrix-associated actin-dependent regulator of chromatin subfamily D
MIPQAFGVEQFQFRDIPNFIKRHLTPPDPVVLHYTIDPSVPPPERPAAWDMELKTEDTFLKGRMNTLLQMSKDSLRDIAKLDEEAWTNLPREGEC